MNDCALTLSVSKTEDPPSVTVWYGNGEHDRIRITDASTCGREQRASVRVDAKTPSHFFTALAERECTGRAEAPTTPFREAYLFCGRRAGKSFVLALIAVFLACFRGASVAPF